MFKHFTGSYFILKRPTLGSLQFHDVIVCNKNNVTWHMYAHTTNALNTPAIFIRNMGELNRIYRRSPLHIEKSQLEGEQIMPETRFIEFSALSVDPRVWISRSHRRPMFD